MAMTDPASGAASTAGTAGAPIAAGAAGGEDAAGLPGAAARAVWLRDVFELALAIRTFEERLEQLFAANLIRGSIHLGIGQEAVAVGARFAAGAGDLVVPTYRGHAWALAWGMTLEQAFGEVLGRQDGCNLGRGGSKHLGSAHLGILPGNAIVAAGLPIACGTALTAKLNGSGRVTIAPFGDGATNQGVFHEALNLAAIWDLPVVFVCENNLYSEMTPIRQMVRVSSLAARSESYGIPNVSVDGMDALAVQEVLGQAIGRAAAGGGPTFVEAFTYRFCGHMPGDTQSYRTREEVAAWRERDPVRLLAGRLAAAGVPAQHIEESVRRVTDRVASAERAALDAPAPSAATIGLGAEPYLTSTR
jgi:acetoin:2,6-dichlorophenolindophenol oxidoreductase subunit alpha